MGSGDFPGPLRPIAEAFLSAMRGFSVPLRLENLRRTPMRTRVYVNAVGVVAVQVPEHGSIPVLRSDWSAEVLEPRKFAGISVITEELLQNTSPEATLTIVDDLAAATAEAENLGFVSPNEVGSVLYAADNFASTGAALANVDADLLRLCNLVPGASHPGAAFVMAQETATFLGLLRGSSGCAAFPDLGPQGGTLLRLPVLVTSACELGDSPPANIIGLLSPSDIFWADEGKVILTTSTSASLKMDDDPDMSAANSVSMFQTDSVATKALRESAWYARPGSGAFFTCAY